MKNISKLVKIRFLISKTFLICFGHLNCGSAATFAICGQLHTIPSFTSSNYFFLTVGPPFCNRVAQKTQHVSFRKFSKAIRTMTLIFAAHHDRTFHTFNENFNFVNSGIANRRKKPWAKSLWRSAFSSSIRKMLQL